jgi:hypothetical protein
MTDSLTMWMTAISSFATAIAAIIAVVTFIHAARQKQAEVLHENANNVRKNLFMIVQESEGLYYLLKNGNILLIGAHEVALEYGRRLGPSATKDDFWKHLGKDDQLMLSVSVNGWHHAKQTDSIYESVRRLKNISASLRGNLSAVRYALELLDGIVNDAYSPIIFITMMQKGSPLIMKKHKTEEDLNALINELSSELMSNAAAYFATRYYNSIKLLKDFIELFAYGVADLDDDGVLSVMRSKTREIERMPYITDKMKTLVEKLEAALPKEIYKELEKLVDKIQHSVSKESAKKELASLHREIKNKEEWDDLVAE